MLNLRKCLMSLLCVSMIFATLQPLSINAYSVTNDEISSYTISSEFEIGIDGVSFERNIGKTIEGIYVSHELSEINEITDTDGLFNVNELGRSSRATQFNSNPNSAIFIPDPWKNEWLMNVSTANESWYMFFGDAGTKLTVALDQPSGGIYVVELYRLIGNTLFWVTDSIYLNSSMRQQTSHEVPFENLYFLRIIPVIPVNGIYYFMVHVSHEFDQAEVDDNALDARTHWFPLVVNSQTIDSYIDVDWFRFTTGNIRSVDFTLGNVPAGAVYRIDIFDSNTRLLGHFTSAGTESRSFNLATGTVHYVRISSANGGFSATQNYQLVISSHDPNVQNHVFITDFGGGEWTRYWGNRIYRINGSRPLTVTGYVRNNGAPVSNTEVIVTMFNPNWNPDFNRYRRATVVTDSQGRFTATITSAPAVGVFFYHVSGGIHHVFDLVDVYAQVGNVTSDGNRIVVFAFSTFN